MFYFTDFSRTGKSTSLCLLILTARWDCCSWVRPWVSLENKSHPHFPMMPSAHKCLNPQQYWWSNFRNSSNHFSGKSSSSLWFETGMTGFFLFGGILGSASRAIFPVSLSNHVGFTPRLLYGSTHHSPESFTHLKTGWAQDAWLQWSYEKKGWLAFLVFFFLHFHPDRSARELKMLKGGNFFFFSRHWRGGFFLSCTFAVQKVIFSPTNPLHTVSASKLSIWGPETLIDGFCSH